MLMVVQAMLELFARNTGVTSDAIVIQTAFDAGKALHDSIDAMSFEDEVSVRSDSIQSLRALLFMARACRCGRSRGCSASSSGACRSAATSSCI